MQQYQEKLRWVLRRTWMFATFTAVACFLTPCVIAAQQDGIAPPLDGTDPIQTSQPPAVVSTPISDDQLPELVEQLGADEFSIRQQAIRQLRSLTIEQVRTIAEIAGRHSDAEVSQRLMQLLESYYLNADLELSMTAAECLEEAANSDRWMVAESAADVLDRNWERRITLITDELKTLGVAFSPSDPSALWNDPRGAMNFGQQAILPFDRDSLQINLNKDWTGGIRGIELLRRLGSLTGAQANGSFRMMVYLIDGHPLQEAEITLIRAAFPEARVQARGRVCLGITNNIFLSDESGCRVGEVRPGTSAHSAGIQENDLITHMEGIPIRDFDHLVESLRKYDVGDKVKMRVERFREVFRGRFPIPVPEEPQGMGKELEIEVELKGWN